MFLERSLLGLAAVAFAAATTPASSKSLHEFKHFVIIYQENHSFDNLFGLWGSVGGEPVEGLRSADPAHMTQARADGATAFECLLQNDVNLASLATRCTDATGATSFVSAFPNAPFEIDAYIAATDKTCPAPGVFAPHGAPKNAAGALAGGCTRDLVHRFYSEQFQINGGKQNRYVTGSDAAGLSMGYYDTTKLPIYKALHAADAPHYIVADHFFQSAFGGSFLNHQWLVAAATPVFANALNDASAHDLHSVVDANGMATSTPLYTNPLGSSAKDASLTASCDPPAGRPATPANVACGDYVINTIQPFSPPYAPGTAEAKRLPPLEHPTIGDRLSAAGIGWAWYSGGWSNANGDVGAPGWTNGNGPDCGDPNAISGAAYPICPDKLFQFHHQPFNYFKAYARGTAARAAHLRDAAEFVQAAKAGQLEPVSFVKLIGAENEHPGYASEADGSARLVDLIAAIVNGPNARDTLIIITYDEFGGSWDHAPPPPYQKEQVAERDHSPLGEGHRGGGAHDLWGPGTRIPALLISARFERSGVDHTNYDTTSVLKLIEERYGLAPLGTRDASVHSLARALEAGERPEAGER
ncbi:alkaline phosphatase family protein [Methylosinus sp. Ce-a6]|uniref:alkaline phosphatase family protein n=1 Tax=Methylosinus sp. Ce-a6 TaxID=2172005 RepID=UPI00135CEF3F|nr:alkaline phosphatase family protein [Methylosinus sp. Ce-a6]